MAYIYDIADTWAASGTVFTGIKLNVTDTASAAGSLLMDLQVGGVSQFNIGKTGNVNLKNAWAIVGGSFGLDITRDGTSRLSSGFGFNITSLTIANTPIVNLNLGGASTTDPNIFFGSNLALTKDAANTLAQRNGVNAQAFNLYNTYTDASNYERGFMRFVSNVLQIGTEKLGTGTARALAFQTDGTTRLTIETGGTATFAGNVSAGRFIGNTFIGVGGSGTSPQVWLAAPSSGVLKLTDSGDSAFNRVQFGGTTSSFPAVKRSTTSLQARLADDSAFTNIQGKLTTDTAYTAGVTTPTGYIVLFDGNGTAYKVPAEAL